MSVCVDAYEQFNRPPNWLKREGLAAASA